ncbi:MAG: S-adenosylmethionine decarboxylase [Nanoarchaeota archaeon]|nr:S-adenosylmethionine decarboxylase [Nanoarchaeota archaeon]MBU1028130.1 S-adenosylmethionine decarboxylase [Nanoarchaeota archaeon]
MCFLLFLFIREKFLNRIYIYLDNERGFTYKLTETLSLREKYKKENAWGLLSSIDLYDCDADLIRNSESIKKFVIELCELIKMKRFGECQIVNFGEDERVAGFSMTQLIETSLISAHFANQTKRVFLDVFSCKYYEPKTAAEFAKKFFKAKNYNLNIHLRK